MVVARPGDYSHKPASMPEMAMVLAAGKGTRMHAYESVLPKPLVKVAGKPLITHVLDRLAVAGVSRAVVNLAWKGEMIEAELCKRTGGPELQFSKEGAEPLETGGGVLHALSLLGEKPFFVLNSDVLWTDGAVYALHQLAQHFDAKHMNALLLLAPMKRATGYRGKGDFFLGQNGEMRKRGEQQVAPYIYTGIQILHPRVFTSGLFSHRKDGEFFSLSEMYRSAEANASWLPGIYGLTHDGWWMHVGDGDGVREAETILLSQS